MSAEAVPGNMIQLRGLDFEYADGGFALRIPELSVERGEQIAIMWQKLSSILSNHPSQLMIWEAAPGEETIRRLDSLGISSIAIPPCANTPEEGDWYTTMLESAAHLEKASS